MRKDNSFIFRTTSLEAYAIERLCERLGLTKSEYFRLRARDDYQKEFGKWPPVQKDSADARQPA